MDNFMSLREAGRYANVSHECIRLWAIAYGIGELSNGRWRIDRAKLEPLAQARAAVQNVKVELRQAS